MTSRGLAVAVALCACAGFQPTVKQDPAPSLPRPQRPASAPGGIAFAEARPASVWSSGMPLTLPAASDLCRATGCWLPTAKIVDALYAQASLKLEPRPIPPSAEMMSNAYFSITRTGCRRNSIPSSTGTHGSPPEIWWRGTRRTSC